MKIELFLKKYPTKNAKNFLFKKKKIKNKEQGKN